MEEMVQFSGGRRDLPWVSRQRPKKERARTDFVCIPGVWGLNEQIKKTADRCGGGYRALVRTLCVTSPKLSDEASHMMANLNLSDAAGKTFARRAVPEAKLEESCRRRFLHGRLLTILAPVRVRRWTLAPASTAPGSPAANKEIKIP